MKGNILYHGSLQIVRYPLVNVGRKDLDFGQGFYTTDIEGQAEKWAKTLQGRIRQYRPAYINKYNFDIAHYSNSNFKTLKFEKYDKKWLEFICASRQGEHPWLGYDIIEGGIANDSVIDTVEAYMTGIMDAQTALGRLIYHKPNNQICILNQEIVDKFLSFKESVEI